MKRIITILLLLSCAFGYAQKPNGDFKNMNISGTTLGVGPARFNPHTTAARPGSPAAGYFGYNTDNKVYEYWDGAAWVSMANNQLVADTLYYKVNGSGIYHGYTGSHSDSLYDPSIAWTIRFSVTGDTSVGFTVDLATVGAGGTCTNCNLTIDVYGRVTAFASGSGGGGSVTGFSSSKDTITQTSHGFVIGDAVAKSGATWVKADLTNFIDGVVSKAIDANTFEVTYAGKFAWTSGKTQNVAQFSSSTPGAMTTTSPTISIPIGKQISAGVFLVAIRRPADFTVTSVATDVVQQHTSGATVTVNDGTNVLWVNPASTIASLTITLPTTWHSSKVLKIRFGGTITSGNVVTSITIVAGSGQTLLQNSNPNGLAFVVAEPLTYELLSTFDVRYE